MRLSPRDSRAHTACGGQQSSMSVSSERLLIPLYGVFGNLFLPFGFSVAQSGMLVLAGLRFLPVTFQVDHSVASANFVTKFLDLFTPMLWHMQGSASLHTCVRWLDRDSLQRYVIKPRSRQYVEEQSDKSMAESNVVAQHVSIGCKGTNFFV